MVSKVQPGREAMARMGMPQTGQVMASSNGRRQSGLRACQSRMAGVRPSFSG